MIFRFFILVLCINNTSFSQTSEEKKTHTSSYTSNPKKTISENKNLKTEINVNISEAFLEAGNMNPPIVISVKNTGKNSFPEGKYLIKVKTFKTPLHASVYDKTLFEFQKTIQLSNLIPGSQIEIQSYPFNSPSVEGSYTLKISILKDHHIFNAINSEITTTVTVIE